MLQSRVSYSNLLVLIQLSSSESRIQFNGFAAYAFDFLSKMSFLLTSRTSEQGSEFPASGELREVFARSCRPSLPTRHPPCRRLVVSGVETDDVPDLDETVLVAGYWVAGMDVAMFYGPLRVPNVSTTSHNLPPHGKQGK